MWTTFQTIILREYIF
ncbi:hypothetical protein 105L [Ranavirus ambystoma1]|uniref:Uncharacterized protein n=1 Tax=Ranavirus ambystoma1 TaxID=265294 RepID=A0A0U2S0R9_9VIRU|nr:hypothetical protein 101L [Ambystoma tigrinum virus]ALN36693.1 hypothetical protein 103L [Ambystoma tigrinum virus]ALN37100.1 hypothetical protein 99L [Ambystoma tigrinum virus]ALN37400.1 hypothetical protein 99L [Ambystoma tigrinum virus]ALN37499.1 hypothetical protein 96L [Ambystoma tigrinum virus]